MYTARPFTAHSSLPMLCLAKTPSGPENAMNPDALTVKTFLDSPLVLAEKL
jgi:hypothetical protein